MGIFIHDKCGMNHGRQLAKGEGCGWAKQSKATKPPKQQPKGKK